ncbi:MAG: FAD-dependent oxidoreductase [Chloroflexi bacterium]|nr:FAD-dependent oxidoreductase [Chloroflexota bacterium]
MENNKVVLPDSLLHPAYLEPEIIARARRKTGEWRFLRPILRNRTPPCSGACPAGIDIRQYLEFVRKQDFGEAWKIIELNNPMPAITGRVCYHPCEVDCNRKGLDSALNIHSIERSVGDFALRQSSRRPKVKARKEKVAIVGSGPAGITCGYYLSKLGYPTTVFEASSVAGGMLAVGIPEYRLPRKILAKQIEFLQRFGLEIKTCMAVGNEKGLDDLFDQGYLAVLLATGYQKGRQLNIAGENLPGVIQGIEFLARPATHAQWRNKEVVVIGGGNVAIDSARCALRLGARPLILYRRSRKEMPANEEEAQAALDEGVRIQFLASPVGLKSRNGRLVVQCEQMELGQKDGSGRKQAIAAKGPGFEVEADAVIPAIGQFTDAHLYTANGIETDGQGNVAVDENLLTSRKGVFAAGDCATGPATVALAIGSGRKAAISIDVYLSGKEYPVSKTGEIVQFEQMNLAYFSRQPRQEGKSLAPSARATSFAEVAEGLSKAKVVKEAGRCMECGGCNKCANCWLFCPDGAVLQDGAQLKVALEFCKGCGICAQECPRGVIAMEEETKWQVQ